MILLNLSISVYQKTLHKREKANPQAGRRDYNTQNHCRGWGGEVAPCPGQHSPAGAHLIRRVLHLLHVPSNHVLRVLTCKDTARWARGCLESPPEGLAQDGVRGQRGVGRSHLSAVAAIGLVAEGVRGKGAEIRRWRWSSKS